MPKVDGRMIVIGFLVLMIISISLALARIQFNRFLFWFDVLFIPLSCIAVIVSIIALFRADYWDREDWLVFGGIALVVFLLTFFTINGAYNRGYSDEAIKTKADLKEQLDSYTLILSVYTGTFKLKVEGVVADKLDEALCEALPDTPCEQVKESYDTYKDLIGWKSCADKIDKIIFW